jgi:glutamyl-Q tRNA(Asp) synthetase
VRSAAYRGRFAPSPTGPLHFGSLVAAVVSYLEAKTHHGEWLLRIEDIDPPREIKGIIPAQMSCLAALGFEWDGEVRYQSQNSQRYVDAIDIALSKKKAFYCSCSRSQIASAAISGKEGWVYPGTCRGNSVANALGSSIRVNTEGLDIEFEDLLQGPIFDHLAQDYGDFVIRRADQHFAYLLAVVVDDADQGITDVVRGADLLSTTSRQIALQDALGLPKISYLHFPIATNSNGEKLSKQTHAPSIHSLAASSSASLLLVECLRFLRQNPPPYLEKSSVAEVWSWAIEHWEIQALALERQRVAPLTLALAQ